MDTTLDNMLELGKQYNFLGRAMFYTGPLNTTKSDWLYDRQDNVPVHVLCAFSDYI